MGTASGIFIQPHPAILDDALIEACATAHDAIKLCWMLRAVKIDQNTAAAKCEIKPPHFSNILQGKKYLPPNKIRLFQEVMGNLAITQFLAKESGLRVERESREQAEIRRLRHQIAQMKGVA
jgi:hypothetical protein